MSYWEILQIAPTSDKKAIKKAYAVLLKSNKPDENPEGFAQLHMAYKYCLQAANNQHYEQTLPRESLAEAAKSSVQLDIAYQNSDIPADSVTVNDYGRQTLAADQTVFQADVAVSELPSDNNTREVAVIAGDTETPIPQEQQVEEQEAARIEYLHNAWPVLEQQVNNALETMQHSQDIADWQFVDNNDALYDIEFKAEFSHYLFERLLEFFEQNSIKLQQRSTVLRYLNQVFCWSDHHQQLQSLYGYERTDPLLHQLSELEAAPQTSKLKWVSPKNHKGPIEYGNYYARISATFIDVMVLFLLCAAFTGDDVSLGFVYAILIHTLLMPVLEASPLQGSPGKVLFGMKVTSPKGRRLNIFHSLWRQIVFLASSIGFKVTVWINFFINDGRLLHDRLSYSIVIKR